MKNKIGIFGGSFDPMHVGHIKLARFIADELRLDKLIVIPAAMSPFKSESFSSDEDRLNICRLSLPEGRFEVSDFEMKAGGVSYSFNTAFHFRELYPKDELFFVIGEDQLFIFNKWYRWEELIKTVTLVAVKRNRDTSLSALESFADINIRPYGSCILLPFEPFEVSSTDIRERIKSGRSITGLVAPEAERYIRENRLYLSDFDEEKLKADVKEKLSDYRFHHSMCVASCAKELARRFGGDEKKAYIAGVVHDIMKEQSDDEASAMFENAGVVLSELERRSKKLWHAMTGEIYLREKYALPEDVLKAVRYHTTGREDMTLLEKILFVADFISEDRDYNGVEEMRRRAEKSLELTMEEGLRFTIEDLSRSCRPIHPDTVSAYNQILLGKE